MHAAHIVLCAVCMQHTLCCVQCACSTHCAVCSVHATYIGLCAVCMQHTLCCVQCACSTHRAVCRVHSSHIVLCAVCMQHTLGCVHAAHILIIRLLHRPSAVTNHLDQILHQLLRPHFFPFHLVWSHSTVQLCTSFLRIYQ